jgi:hypothetical protein
MSSSLSSQAFERECLECFDQNSHRLFVQSVRKFVPKEMQWLHMIPAASDLAFASANVHPDFAAFQFWYKAVSWRLQTEDSDNCGVDPVLIQKPWTWRDFMAAFVAQINGSGKQIQKKEDLCFSRFCFGNAATSEGLLDGTVEKSKNLDGKSSAVCKDPADVPAKVQKLTAALSQNAMEQGRWDFHDTSFENRIQTAFRFLKIPGSETSEKKKKCVIETVHLPGVCADKKLQKYLETHQIPPSILAKIFCDVTQQAIEAYTGKNNEITPAMQVPATIISQISTML